MGEKKEGTDSARDEIVVTDEMIEAGVEEFLLFEPGDSPYMVRSIISRIFCAMLAAYETRRSAGVGSHLPST